MMAFSPGGKLEEEEGGRGGRKEGGGRRKERREGKETKHQSKLVTTPDLLAWTEADDGSFTWEG
jgi:hypothetical protein